VVTSSLVITQDGFFADKSQMQPSPLKKTINDGVKQWCHVSLCATKNGNAVISVDGKKACVYAICKQIQNMQTLPSVVISMLR
jgi:hypothetical protein